MSSAMCLNAAVIFIIHYMKWRPILLQKQNRNSFLDWKTSVGWIKITDSSHKAWLVHLLFLGFRVHSIEHLILWLQSSFSPKSYSTQVVQSGSVISKCGENEGNISPFRSRPSAKDSYNWLENENKMLWNLCLICQHRVCVNWFQRVPQAPLTPLFLYYLVMVVSLRLLPSLYWFLGGHSRNYGFGSKLTYSR